MSNYLKMKIVRDNINLPQHEIKKKLREIEPNIQNDEVEKLIIEALRDLKKEEEELER